jgi:hypothetical protein
MENADEKKKETNLIIDKVQYMYDGERATGSQIRQIPTPPISDEYDLYEKVEDGRDKLIGDSEEVNLEGKEKHFLSAPRNITPGQGSAE